MVKRIAAQVFEASQSDRELDDSLGSNIDNGGRG
jgi:hypothetical protein